jgi:hypothetical protein
MPHFTGFCSFERLRMSTRIGSLRVLLLVAFVLLGCGPREVAVKDRIQVRGRATLQGEPIRYALIFFDPVDTKGMPASGSTDADGYFDLYTIGNEAPDGIVPGSYKVRFEQGAAQPQGGIPKGEPTWTEIPPDTEVEIVVDDSVSELEVIVS